MPEHSVLSGQSSEEGNWRWYLPTKELENSRDDEAGTEKQVSLLNINFALALNLGFSVLETTRVHLQNKQIRLPPLSCF